MNTDRTDLSRIRALVGSLPGAPSFECEEAEETVRGISRILFGTDVLKHRFTGKTWAQAVENYLDAQLSRGNRQDRVFYGILQYARMVDTEEMIRIGKENFRKMDEQTQERYESFYNSFSGFWGTIDLKTDRFEVLERRIRILEEKGTELAWLYERLADRRSKEVLVSTLKNWLSFDVREIVHMRDRSFPQYFDADLYQTDENEVFVDLGAYTGDSAAAFIDSFGKYRKIYCYEITPESCAKMEKNLRCFPNVEIRRKGVGKETGQLYLSGSDVRASANALGNASGIPVDTVTLDEDITEKITLLKMDIEGAEQDALRGAERHIREERPKLLISVYHGNTDLFEIPGLIDSIRGDYRFYLRSYGNLWAPAEIVLYAV